MNKTALMAALAACVIVLGACADSDSGSDDTGGGFIGDGDGDGGGDGDGDGDGEPPPPEDEDDEEDPPEEEEETEPPEDECDADTPVVLYLSPDDSNSMSSPVQVREAVLSGWNSLDALAIRPWEFMNYYHFGYEPAPAGELELHAQMRPISGAEEGDARFAMQIGVSSEALDNTERAPMNITFVLDTSGSMGGHSIEMLKSSCLAIAESLREGDVVSMVTWNTDNNVLLAGHQVTGPSDSQLVSLIEGITASGGTNLHAGLVSGYELAAASEDPERIDRILLISDGGANVGVTDEEIIAAHAGSNDQDGIYMVGVGVGTHETYNDLLMDRVTDVGKGASVFISDEQEVHRIFGDDFVNTFAVAARDVQVELDLPPGFEITRFSGEEYSEDPAEIEPQHIAPNDAMVFYQTLTTCAPEMADDDAVIRITARYKDAITFEEHEVALERTIAELSGSSQQLAKGRAVLDYADALLTLQGKNKGDPVSVSDALHSVTVAEEMLPEDEELAEIRQVLEAL